MSRQVTHHCMKPFIGIVLMYSGNCKIGPEMRKLDEGLINVFEQGQNFVSTELQRNQKHK